MILAPKGIYAYYKQGEPEAHIKEPVVAFRGDGVAMILSLKGRLVPADEPENFVYLDWDEMVLE